MKVFPSFLQLHGKTYDYKIPYTSVLRLFLLPHKDQRFMFFVVSVKCNTCICKYSWTSLQWLPWGQSLPAFVKRWPLLEVKISANLPTGMKMFGHSIEVAIVGTALSSSFDSTIHLFSTPLTNFIGEFYRQQAILPIALRINQAHLAVTGVTLYWSSWQPCGEVALSRGLT